MHIESVYSGLISINQCYLWIELKNESKNKAFNLHNNKDETKIFTIEID